MAITAKLPLFGRANVKSTAMFDCKQWQSAAAKVALLEELQGRNVNNSTEVGTGIKRTFG